MFMIGCSKNVDINHGSLEIIYEISFCRIFICSLCFELLSNVVRMWVSYRMLCQNNTPYWIAQYCFGHHILTLIGFSFFYYQMKTGWLESSLQSIDWLMYKSRYHPHTRRCKFYLRLECLLQTKRIVLVICTFLALAWRWFQSIYMLHRWYELQFDAYLEYTNRIYGQFHFD